MAPGCPWAHRLHAASSCHHKSCRRSTVRLRSSAVRLRSTVRLHEPPPPPEPSALLCLGWLPPALTRLPMACPGSQDSGSVVVFSAARALTVAHIAWCFSVIQALSLVRPCLASCPVHRRLACDLQFASAASAIALAMACCLPVMCLVCTILPRELRHGSHISFTVALSGMHLSLWPAGACSALPRCASRAASRASVA